MIVKTMKAQHNQKVIKRVMNKMIQIHQHQQ
jgi:hypothetical protein